MCAARRAHWAVDLLLELLELFGLLVELGDELVALLELPGKVVPVVLEESERAVLRAPVGERHRCSSAACS